MGWIAIMRQQLTRAATYCTVPRSHCIARLKHSIHRGPEPRLQLSAAFSTSRNWVAVAERPVGQLLVGLQGTGLHIPGSLTICRSLGAAVPVMDRTEEREATGEQPFKRQKTDSGAPPVSHGVASSHEAALKAGSTAPAPTAAAATSTVVAPGAVPSAEPTTAADDKAAGVTTKKSRGKKQTQTPAKRIGQLVVAATKSGDPDAALQHYDTAVAEGIVLPLQTFNTLLFLCTGQECWENYIGKTGVHTRILKSNRGGSGPVETDPKGGGLSEADAQRLADRADEILIKMAELGHKPDDVAYTSMARLAAIRGDYHKALEMAEKAAGLSNTAKLRWFLPAMYGFADEGNVDAALALDERISSHKLDLTETEYALLLEAVRKGGSYEQFAAVLQRMSRELNHLTELTLSIIRSFFLESPAALEAFKEGRPHEGKGSGWEAVRASVEESGKCEAAGADVQVIDLREEEWQTFADSIANLATQRESRDSFRHYIEWFNRNGPYDVMVDGANVAFYGQNREGGGFNWEQIGAVVDVLQKQLPGKKILVMVHQKRLQDEAGRSPRAQELIERLKRTKSFYFTPKGSNDDWYWMYATVRSGPKAMLVSNDELRDHIFQLLRPKHFLKWKERHIIHYAFTPNNPPSLTLPPKYTPCTQLLENGTWMFPSAEKGDWLCVRARA